MAEETWWLELDSPEIAQASQPGQFVMIGFGCGNTGAPLLPRPFSVGWRSDAGRIGLLVREFGSGTTRLSRLHRGEEVLLLGPLGQPFRFGAEQPVICVAGGVGLAPFLFLVGEARRAGVDVSLLYGERDARRVFDPAMIESLCGTEAEIWTEDGGAGRAGRVLEGLTPDPGVAVLGCGPTAMLHALFQFTRTHGMQLQVSVEEHMGCGVGTCQGCVVRGADGSWRKSCTEGPVFDAADLDWTR